MTQKISKDLTFQLNQYFYQEAFGRQFLDISMHDRQNIYPQFRKNQMFERRQHSNLSIKDQMRLNANRYKNIHKMYKQRKFNHAWFLDSDVNFQLFGLPLNTLAFYVTINLLGNEQQRKYWLTLITQGKIVGAYGQTQLGHGSNVQGIQTVAHYNSQTDEFILNSPKITSAKFWPGVLGIYGSHTVLQAKTYVNKKSIGVQTFVLQIRNSQLQPLQGVSGGDIGPKLGFKRVDNGYLELKEFKIPRTNMLMKYVQVNKEGKVFGLQNKQAVKYGYGSMLNLRVRLVLAFSIGFMARASIQYFRIFEKLKMDKNISLSKENMGQVLKYLCCGYGYVISNMYTQTVFKRFLKQVSAQNFNAADQCLVQCHIISSTLKAMSSSKSMKILTHYLSSNKLTSFMSSFISSYFVECSPSVTYQGDNTVLYQQTAKYLIMKSSQQVYQKDKRPDNKVNPNDFENVMNVLTWVLSQQIKRIKDLFEKQTEKGVGFNTFWNQIFQCELINVAKLWGVKACVNGIIKQLNKDKNNLKLKQLLKKISIVFINVLLAQDCQIVSMYGFEIDNEILLQKTVGMFNQQQLNALMNPNRALWRENEDNPFSRFYLPGRGNEWTRPRL